jgi:hypothetical protein
MEGSCVFEFDYRVELGLVAKRENAEVRSQTAELIAEVGGQIAEVKP